MHDYDLSIVLGTIIVFSLPLTLLIPDFSIWSYIPKVRVSRFHILSKELTWTQLNVAVVLSMAVLFCLFLEFRKRKLDDIVNSILGVTQRTNDVLEVEKVKQAATVNACMNALEASVEHYERLALLKDDLRNRRKGQYPPAIEPSMLEVM